MTTSEGSDTDPDHRDIEPGGMRAADATEQPELDALDSEYREVD